MKVIMNGKMYNTETAKNVGSWNTEDNYDGFYYNVQTLYKKKTGEFFIYDYGMNPRHKWEKIEKLTEKQAKEWSEKHLSTEEYIEIFGDVEE